MKKGSLIIVSMLVLAIAVLATLLFKAWYSEADALRNTAADAAVCYEIYTKEARAKTDEFVGALSEKVREPGHAEKYQPFYDDILVIRTTADSLFKYLDDVTDVLKKQGLAGIRVSASRNIPHDLRVRLDAAYARMLAQFHGYDSGSMDKELRLEMYVTDFGNTTGWENRLFGHGATKSTMLINIARVKSSLAGVESYFARRMYEVSRPRCELWFSPYGAVAIPRQTYSLPGDKCEASILLLNTYRGDKQKEPIEITIGNKKVPVINGVGNYKFIAGKPGLHTVRGKLKADDLGDASGSYDFIFEYMVGGIHTDVTYDKPIQFEAGKECPIVVTVCGFMPEDVSVSLSRGTITGGNGHYIVKVDESGPVTLSVSLHYRDGSRKDGGTYTYEVK